MKRILALGAVAVLLCTLTSCSLPSLSSLSLPFFSSDSATTQETTPSISLTYEEYLSMSAEDWEELREKFLSDIEFELWFEKFAEQYDDGFEPITIPKKEEDKEDAVETEDSTFFEEDTFVVENETESEPEESSESAEEPTAEEPVVTAEAPAQQPVQQTVQQPVQQPVQQTVWQPVQQTVWQPPVTVVTAPAPEPEPEPEPEPALNPDDYSYEDYLAMSTAEKGKLAEAFSSDSEFTAWLYSREEEYNRKNEPAPTVKAEPRTVPPYTEIDFDYYCTLTVEEETVLMAQFESNDAYKAWLRTIRP